MKAYRTLSISLLLAIVGSCQQQDIERPVIASDEGFVVTADGVRLHYVVQGQGGDTAILVHGTPASMYSLAPDFAPLANAMVLIAYDQRGGGQSDLAETVEDLAWQHHVEDLDAVRAHFGLFRLNLIGISWGSYLSTLYAREHPDRVNRIVLFPARVDTNGMWPEGVSRPASPIDSAGQARLAELRAAWDTTADIVATCQEYWAIQGQALYFRPTGPEMVGSFCNEPPAVLRQTWWASDAKLASVAGYDFREVVVDVSAPILVVKGREAGLPVSWIEPWAASAQDGRMLWVEQAGTSVWVEAPDEVFPALLQFFSGSWPANAFRPS